jgi:anti-sigma B factor antagonist
MPDITIATSAAGDGVRLEVGGEIDYASVDRLRAAIERADDAAPLLLDLSDVTFMDSMGLGLIISTNRRPAGLRVLPSEAVAEVLRVTGVGQILTVVPKEA